MKKKAFITGAGGFIGANLARALLDGGYEVHALLKRSTDDWRLRDVKKRLTIHYGALDSKKALVAALKRAKPTHIFHLAQHGGYPFQKDSQLIFDVNLQGTINLLEAAEIFGFKKFIHTGSQSEYGVKARPMKETDVLQPQTPYGVAKAAATLYCQYRAKTQQLPIVVLRLFSVFGPWEESGRLVTTLALGCVTGEDIMLASPYAVRDYVYVGDVVKAYMRAATVRCGPGEIFNVAGGHQRSTKEMALLAKKISGAPSRLRFGTLKGRSFDAKTWVGDTHKTERILGVKPGRIEDGMKETIQWFNEHKDAYR